MRLPHLSRGKFQDRNRAKTHRCICRRSQLGSWRKRRLFLRAQVQRKTRRELLRAPSAVNNALLELETSYDQALGAFKLLETQRKNFYDMALLQYVAQQTKALMSAQQQIRISEFNQLISQLVQGEQAPYIYERFRDSLRTLLARRIPRYLTFAMG